MAQRPLYLSQQCHGADDATNHDANSYTDDSKAHVELVESSLLLTGLPVVHHAMQLLLREFQGSQTAQVVPFFKNVSQGLSGS